jgi:hypothetical protein
MRNCQGILTRLGTLGTLGPSPIVRERKDPADWLGG